MLHHEFLKDEVILTAVTVNLNGQAFFGLKKTRSLYDCNIFKLTKINDLMKMKQLTIITRR